MGTLMTSASRAKQTFTLIQDEASNAIVTGHGMAERPVK
jgi:hypothetical protein